MSGLTIKKINEHFHEGYAIGPVEPTMLDDNPYPEPTMDTNANESNQNEVQFPQEVENSQDDNVNSEIAPMVALIEAHLLTD